MRSAPEVSRSRPEGFGTQLADRVIRGQLGATLTREWRPEGLRVTVELLRAGEGQA